ncbi:hypothetical protein A7A08_01290 [Methyloligella halotolerans]|uniref:Uncharacterized protein n=1 Tax=Methyloligella halotolerans TaxID=1177755 RepID=A0A1E2S144_9HYPH|nr:hypothetical protein [Methyloligella halotolerans]ODA68120.1 hypothetical protein A7A08_01290 [Methyloligella halotolerans]
MPILALIAWFFAGALAVNAIPHLVSGCMGRPFQTPFARPLGEGVSSSTVNVLWGFANLIVAWLLLARVGAFDWRLPLHILIFLLGALLVALYLARRFGRYNGGNL